MATARRSPPPLGVAHVGHPIFTEPELGLELEPEPEPEPELELELEPEPKPRAETRGVGSEPGT
jgi:hypothetical protein